MAGLVRRVTVWQVRPWGAGPQPVCQLSPSCYRPEPSVAQPHFAEISSSIRVLRDNAFRGGSSHGELADRILQRHEFEAVVTGCEAARRTRAAACRSAAPNFHFPLAFR